LVGVRLFLLVAFLLLQGLEVDPNIPGSAAVTTADCLQGLAGGGLDPEILMAGVHFPITLGPDQSVSDAIAEPKAQAEGQQGTPVAAGGGAGGGNRDHGRREVGED
jgi:hypothetical protein